MITLQDIFLNYNKAIFEFMPKVDNFFSSLFPVNNGVVTQASTSGGIIAFFRTVLIVIFVIVIIAAIAFAVISGFKYISSQGESSKVEEAQESLKYVLLGVGAIFVGIIGIIIITNIFADTNTQGITNSLNCFLSGHLTGSTCTSP